MQYKSIRSGISGKIILILASAFMALVMGAVISYIRIDIPFNLMELMAFTLLLLAVSFPYLIVIFERKRDIFEPVYLVSFITFLYFFLIPVALVYQPGGFYYFGVNYRKLLAPSIFSAFIALIGFYAGYYFGKRYLNIKGNWLININRKKVLKILAISTWIISMLVFTWIFASGFPIWALNIFDERADYGTWFELSQTNIGYLYSARLAYIPLLLLFLAYRSKKYPGLMWLLGYASIAVLYLIMGVRIAPITLFVATIIYLYLEKSTRPKPITLLMVSFVLFILNGSIGIARNLDQDFVLSISESWRTFLDGNSIVYGMAMVMLIFPGLVPLQHGRILISDLLLPVPRILWQSKPSNVLIESIKSVVPVHYSPPVFGGWYADFGWIGPFVLMLIIGLCCSYIYITWKQYPEKPATQVLLAISLASLIMIYTRVNAVVFTWIFWVIIPIFVIHFLAKRF